MGWWSKTIMGGDSPLDYLAVLGRAVGIEFDIDTDDENFHGYRFTPEAMESRMDEIKESLRKHKDPIYGQVVGAAFLWAGAEMPEELKSRVIGDAEKDEWAAEGDEERQGYIDDLAQKVANHKPGERVELAYEGLFDKFAQVMGT